MDEPVPRSRSRPRRSCRDKVRYRFAWVAAEMAARQSVELGADLSHYRCPHCGFWHTGNTPAVIRAARLDDEYGVFSGQEQT